jgi:L-ascorbate metabolism protein UlaG (beta-lactamase superfamily)
MTFSTLGATSRGGRLSRIRSSKNFRDGKFQNLTVTPALAEGTSVPQVMLKFFFGKDPHNRPKQIIPSIKTAIDEIHDDSLIWFGHSSYFFKLDGHSFLVDPVFSGHASPLPGGVKAFPGANSYGAIDIPPLDYLLITHDHYDHLDHKTIVALKPKVKQVICGLGVGAHLEHWGYDPSIITELDWFEAISLTDKIHLTATPTRHFSGRSLKRNSTLWLSFVLRAPNFRLYLGGDSGYETHFKTIGDQFGPFDLAILEDGQYNPAWKYIHMMPEELLLAAQDLKAKHIMPVHWAKFALSIHAWDEPIKRLITANAQASKLTPIITPMIGELVDLHDLDKIFRPWWEDVG